MLKLSAAASYFDRTPVVDAYTGAVICYGQVDPYDESKRDAGAAYRRVLSVAPGQVLPAHGAVSVLGMTWLVGRRERDGLQELHRDKYVLQPVDTQFNVATLTGYLSGTPRASAFAAPEPVKTGKEAESSSDVVIFNNVYLSPAVQLAKHEVVWSAQGAFLALSTQVLPSGLKAAYSVLLDHGPEDASVISRTFDPVNGTHAATAPVTVKVLRVRWQNLFEYPGQIAERYQEGDDVFVFPTGTAVDASTLFELAGKSWRVLAVSDLGGAVTVHGRPA